MSNGEKACQLIYQLAARVQLSVLSGWKAVGLWDRAGAPGCVCHSPCYMAMRPRAKGENESSVGVYRGQEEPRTSPRAYTQGNAGSKKTVCTQNIYHGVRADDHRG